MPAPAIETRLRTAVQQFWVTRDRQAEQQGARSGIRDQGARAAVTGGAHLNGFIELLRAILLEASLPEASIYSSASTEIPGFYRPEKRWDLLVVVDERLLATIEFKAQVGPSFGNNYNNRSEEAIGNATDYWAAYREGAFAPSPRPWLGYVMLLEDCKASRSPVAVREPHYRVFSEFRGASYARRYEILFTKLVRERLYDAACFLLSPRVDGATAGAYTEPSKELGFENFAAQLMAHAIAYERTHR